MLPIASLNMWRMFNTASRVSAKAIYQGVIDTGRVTAGAGLVTLGFYGYEQVTPAISSITIDPKALEREEIKVTSAP